MASNAYMPLHAADMAAPSVVKPATWTYEAKRRGPTKRMGALRGRVCRGTTREERTVAGRGFALREMLAWRGDTYREVGLMGVGQMGGLTAPIVDE